MQRYAAERQAAKEAAKEAAKDLLSSFGDANLSVNNNTDNNNSNNDTENANSQDTRKNNTDNNDSRPDTTDAKKPQDERSEPSATSSSDDVADFVPASKQAPDVAAADAKKTGSSPAKTPDNLNADTNPAAPPAGDVMRDAVAGLSETTSSTNTHSSSKEKNDSERTPQAVSAPSEAAAKENVEGATPQKEQVAAENSPQPSPQQSPQLSKKPPKTEAEQREDVVVHAGQEMMIPIATEKMLRRKILSVGDEIGKVRRGNTQKRKNAKITPSSFAFRDLMVLFTWLVI